MQLESLKELTPFKKLVEVYYGMSDKIFRTLREEGLFTLSPKLGPKTVRVPNRRPRSGDWT